MIIDKSTIYFGYGSNLWKQQMRQRCPTSEYLGIARLNSYRWIINERGYANVVQIEKNVERSKYCNEVWGLVYSLEKSDEERLDLNEGVPTAYTKEDLNVDFWEADNGRTPDTGKKPQRTSMLVYINRKQVSPDKPKTEYIYRMNMGIKDALKEGVPEKYVEKVMREFIPESDGKAAEVVRAQALVFKDER